MPYNSAALANLVGSRLCHDLISPIGAIQNGLELMSLAGTNAIGTEELQLVGDSCASATARIQYFRIAFGLASDGQSLNAQEIARITANYSVGSRCSIEATIQGEVERPEAQCLLLAALCCEAGLPLGGTVTIARDGARWKLTATGRRIAVDPDTWSLLNEGTNAAEVRPANVQFPLLHVLAAERGLALATEASESQLVMTLGG